MNRSPLHNLTIESYYYIFKTLLTRPKTQFRGDKMSERFGRTQKTPTPRSATARFPRKKLVTLRIFLCWSMTTITVIFPGEPNTLAIRCGSELWHDCIFSFCGNRCGKWELIAMIFDIITSSILWKWVLVENYSWHAMGVLSIWVYGLCFFLFW